MQAFGVARREAELVARAQAYNDPVASGVVVRSLRPWAAQPRFAARLGRLELLRRQLSYASVSTPLVASSVLGDQSQGTPRFRLGAADRLPHLRPEQVDHHDPARPDDVDARRRMVVGIDGDPQALAAQDRRHYPSAMSVLI